MDIRTQIEAIIADQNPWRSAPLDRRASQYPIRRHLYSEVWRRLQDEGERRALLVLGPRQVGKTVLLLQLADALLDAGFPAQNVVYFDFSDDRLVGSGEGLSGGRTAREIVQHVEAQMVREKPLMLLFDEIRLSVGWDRWLKTTVDHTNHRVVVTDSASSELKRGTKESGLGRWDEFELETLSFREYLAFRRERILPTEEAPAEALFELQRFLLTGGFPEHVRGDSLGEVRRRLRSDLADRAIRRDLLQTGIDVDRVRQLFTYLIQDSGSLFDASSRARDLDADPRSVRQWLQALAETHLVIPLEQDRRRASARLRSKPKLYAADHGLVVAFSPLPRPLDDAHAQGQVFEAVVYRHLRDLRRNRECEVSFFRQRDRYEIDFILENDRGRCALEVTSGRQPRPAKLEQLLHNGRIAGANRFILIHGGEFNDRSGDSEYVALHSFLTNPGQVLP